jgi:hypothetical protein
MEMKPADVAGDAPVLKSVGMPRQDRIAEMGERQLAGQVVLARVLRHRGREGQPLEACDQRRAALGEFVERMIEAQIAEKESLLCFIESRIEV